MEVSCCGRGGFPRAKLGRVESATWRRYGADERRNTMPAIDEDDRPKKKLSHEIGQDLTLLSVAELTERINLLREEITRLEADIARKQATRSAADAFFKK
jgi:uncharacterized small protein (DUF1192 family)